MSDPTVEPAVTANEPLPPAADAPPVTVATTEPTKDGDAPAAAAGAPAEEVKLVTLGELFKFADGTDKALMISGAIAAFINGGGMPAFSEVFGRLVNELSADGSNVEEKVSEVALIMVYVGIVVFVLSVISTMTWMIAAERQSNRIRRNYFEALLSQDAAFYDENKPGALSARLAGDIRVIKVGINDKVTTGIMNFGMFIFGYGLGFYRSWQLTLVMFGTLPLIAGVGILMSVILESATKANRENFAAASAVSAEVLQSIRTVQTFGGEEREVTRFQAALHLAGSSGIKRDFSTALGVGASYGVIFASYSLAFWFGGYLIREGHNNVGDIVAVFFSVMMGSFGIGLVFPTLGALSEAQGAAYKVYEVLDRKPAIDPRVPGVVPVELQGAIDFKNVAFSYPTRREVKLFTDLNLSIAPGTTVAFSGASGCGKSSIIALVQRLYDPDQGAVLIDGIDLKTIDLNWWRDNVGVVAQEPSLFGGTVRENILVGRSDATDEEVVEACKQANIHDTIMSLPGKYDSSVGSVGSQLSGGQKQRLAIARAIIKRPKLLILDEATSALDRKSEAEVQAALDKIMKGNSVGGIKLTVLVIAHRLTTIRNADVIHFISHDDLEGSVVAESGSYDQLLEQGGAFAAMVMKQKRSMQEEEQDAVLEENEECEADRQPDAVVGATVVNVDTPGVKNSSFGSSFAKKQTLEEKAKEEVDSKDVPLTRIIKLSMEKLWAVLIGILGSLISGGIYPAYAVVMGNMLEVLGTKTNQEIEDETPFWAGMFVMLGVAVFIGWTLQGFYGISGEYVTERLRTMLFRNILRQDQTFFDTPGRDAGNLGIVLDGDTEAVHQLWGPSLGYKIQAACNITAGMIIALVYQWKLALVTMSIIPIMAFSSAIQQMLLVGLGTAVEGEAKEDDVIAESLNNIRTVSAFNIAKRQSDRFAAKVLIEEERGNRIGVIAGLAFGFSQFTFYGAFALAYWYGGKLIQDGEATFGDVMIVSMAVLMGAMGAGEAGGFASKSADARVAAQRVFALIDHEPGIDILDTGRSDIGSGATIEFDNVRFIYPARPDAVVLRHFTNTFKDGQSIGLMGSTGCGKSTLIQMLGRFYDPVHGHITVNGVDLKEIDLKWWRSEISAVLQEPSLFSGSVRDNIRYAVPDASDADVERVARLAAIHDEILAMPQGYDTDVGYKGRSLSGGQKQRVAIARGLLRNPRLLLLDEATSALDNATEALVMQGLRQYCSVHKTSIVSVAHRLTTIQDSNKIVLLDAGVVLEEGSHDELIALDGHYARRWEQYEAAMK